MRYTYESVKEHYEKTKPIRGRGVEIRPCGNRRKDWQQIIKHEDNSYSYRLYQTDCVTYKPDDTIVIHPNNWHSPLTGEFITAWSPFVSYRRHNVLWVDAYGTKVPLDKPLLIRYVRYVQDSTQYKTYEPTYQAYQVKQVNRQRAKQARKGFDPFLSWLKTFLSLSDGWVTFDTIENARSKDIGAIDANKMDVFKQPDEDNLYVALLSHMLETSNGLCYETRQATPREPQNKRWARDKRYKYETLRKYLYKMHERTTPEIFDAISFMPDDKERMNVIKNPQDLTES